MRIDAQHIIEALGGRWRGSSGSARCPGHEDKNPSLSVTERDGRVLFHCWAGCEQSAVLDALRARGLWHSSPRTALPPVMRVKPRDDRELQWLLDDVRLLDLEPGAEQAWSVLQDAAAISPLALDLFSRALRRHRPASEPFVRQWFDRYMQPEEFPQELPQ